MKLVPSTGTILGWNFFKCRLQLAPVIAIPSQLPILQCFLVCLLDFEVSIEADDEIIDGAHTDLASTSSSAASDSVSSIGAISLKTIGGAAVPAEALSGGCFSSSSSSSSSSVSYLFASTRALAVAAFCCALPLRLAPLVAVVTGFSLFFYGFRAGVPHFSTGVFSKVISSAAMSQYF
jgi:hypothetical protein